MGRGVECNPCTVASKLYEFQITYLFVVILLTQKSAPSLFSPTKPRVVFIWIGNQWTVLFKGVVAEALASRVEKAQQQAAFSLSAKKLDVQQKPV